MGAVIFSNLGAAYGTAKSGSGIAAMGVMRPDLVMRSIVPVIMAGVLGIYGLITGILINDKITASTYSAYTAFAHLAAGITVGVMQVSELLRSSHAFLLVHS